MDFKFNTVHAITLLTIGVLILTGTVIIQSKRISKLEQTTLKLSS